MSSLICIDFGNSYTKVAIRKSVEGPTELMRDDSLTLDDQIYICIPTIAAQVAGDAKEWYYGLDVLQFQADTDGLRVFRNWKPRFFEGPGAADAPVKAAPVAAVESTGHLPKHLRKQIGPGMGIPDLDSPVWAVIEAGIRSGTITLPNVVSPPPSKPAKPAQTDMLYKNIGRGFFHWLRETLVQPACDKAGLGNVANIPVRITRPSFGGMTRAELLLREMLEEAGWRPEDKLPTIAEPLANAIGIFTLGVNALRRQKASFGPGMTVAPDYSKMFAGTGLLERIQDWMHRDGPNVAWTLIADFGGYTIDFAMVGIQLSAPDAELSGNIDGKRRAAHRSHEVGVAALDERVREVLSPQHTALFQELLDDPDQSRLETMHRTIYGRNRPFVLGRRGTIGKDSEMKDIRCVVQDFAADITELAERFMTLHQYEHIDDLILTGGGMMIPVIRDALCTFLQQYRTIAGQPKIHLFTLSDESAPLGSKPLNRDLVRGATALGGSSVYFDYAEH